MSIQEHLNKIRNAIKGSEVRESIAKGIETAYDDASEKDNANMEVKIARGTNPNLNTRLNKMDETDKQTTAQLAQKVGGGKLATLNDLDEETLNFIHDGTGGPITIESVPKDESVSEIKTTFARKGKNKFSGNYISDIIINGPTVVNGQTQGSLGNRVGAKTAIEKVEKNKVYTISRGEGGNRFRVGITSGEPKVGDTIPRYVFYEDNQYLTTVKLQGEEDHIIITVDNGSGTVPEWLQIEEGSTRTRYAPKSTVYDIEEHSIGVESLQGVRSTGVLSGHPSAFNVDLVSKKITTRNDSSLPGRVNVGTERFDLTDGEWSYGHIDTWTVFVAFDVASGEIKFFTNISVSDRENTKHPIIGVINISGAVDINGTHTINGKVLKPYADYSKATLSGHPNAFNIDLVNKKITTKDVSSAIGRVNVGTERFDLTDGEWSYGHINTWTVFVAFDTKTREIKFFTNVSVSDRDVSRYPIIGSINTSGAIDMNGVYSINNRIVKPFINYSNILFTDNISGNYESKSVVGTYKIGGDTAERVYSFYDDLVDEFPDFVSRKLMGIESSGLPIYRYDFKPEITQGLFRSFPTIVYVSGTHGGEQLAPFSGASFFTELCRNWKENDVLRLLRWNFHFSVVPLLNPYGFENGTRKNANGVDINRNFPYGWAYEPDTESSFYGGEEPSSELETQFMVDLISELPNAILGIDNHNFGPLTTTGYAYWLGGEGENLRRLTIALGNQLSSTIKQKYDFVDQSNNNLTLITDSIGGSLAKYFESREMKGLLMETATIHDLGGTTEDSYAVNIDAIGNVFLALVKNYDDLQ